MSGRLIAIDFDDVLFPFNAQVLSIVNERYNLNIDHLEVHVHGDYKMPQLKDVKLQPIINEVVTSTYLDREPVAHAHEVVERLKQNGDTLILMTARDERCRPTTEKWLHHHFNGLFSDFYMLSNKWQADDPSTVKTKAQVCEELSVDWLIDDFPAYAEAAHTNGTKTILFGDYLWNSGEIRDTIPHAHDWLDVAEILGV